MKNIRYYVRIRIGVYGNEQPHVQVRYGNEMHIVVTSAVHVIGF
jgi:hypothetical protein